MSEKQRKKYEEKDVVEVRVRCSGHLHKIVYNAGRLQLKDHNKDQHIAYRTMSRLGKGDAWRCFHILDAWRKRPRRRYSTGLSTERLPPTIQHLLHDIALPKHWAREEEASTARYALKMSGGDPKSRSLVAIRSIATRLLVESRLLGDWPGRRSATVYERYGYDSSISGYTVGENYVTLSAAIDLAEWAKVYLAGLALVDGLFVLEAQPAGELDGQPASQVKTGREDPDRGWPCLEKANAIVVKGSDGVWHFHHWEDGGESVSPEVTTVTEENNDTST